MWNRFPPVFSPQTGRSTEGLRFRVGLLKTAPESPTVDAVSLDESARTGGGLGSICRDLLDPICVNSTV